VAKKSVRAIASDACCYSPVGLALRAAVAKRLRRSTADMLVRTGRISLAFPIKCLLLAVAAVILPACATENINSSSAGTPSTQATISADSKVWAFSFLPGSFIAVTIDSVDGQKVGSGTSKVSVDPGAHKISVTCHAVGAENTEEISVYAFAGAHYQLSALVGGNRPVPCTSIVQRKSKS
jgi:hypothetical protein